MIGTCVLPGDLVGSKSSLDLGLALYRSPDDAFEAGGKAVIGELKTETVLVVCSLARSDRYTHAITYVVGALWNGSVVWMSVRWLIVLSEQNLNDSDSALLYERELEIREMFTNRVAGSAPLMIVPNAVRPPGPTINKIVKTLLKFLNSLFVRSANNE